MEILELFCTAGALISVPVIVGVRMILEWDEKRHWIGWFAVHLRQLDLADTYCEMCGMQMVHDPIVSRYLKHDGSPVYKDSSRCIFGCPTRTTSVHEYILVDGKRKSVTEEL